MPTPVPGKPMQPGGGDNTLLIAVGLGIVAGVATIVWIATAVGAWVGGRAVPASTPLGLPGAAIKGTLSFGIVEALVSAVLLGVTIAVGYVIYQWRSNRSAPDKPVDSALPHLASGKELDSLSEEAVRAKADRLRVLVPDNVVPGVLLGAEVKSGRFLYGSYEDLVTVIMGPRRGKSTSLVIPWIMGAPGAVVTTSNKRDVLDATRLYRESRGPVWIFDPQSVADGEPTWWWNPLTWVTGHEGAEDVRAAKLADRFASSVSDGDKKDAYFEPEGQGLLAAIILGCALDHSCITRVWDMVNSPVRCRELLPALAANDFDSYYKELLQWINLTEKQRDGIFGTAKKMCSVLRFKEIRRWITDDGTGKPHFDPDEFVTSYGTLYSLSMEGPGAAGAIVTALTVAVIEAGEELGARSPGGRLRTPLTVPLDEAANVVRWSELPDKYSHLGSRGILVQTILQSWAQGVACWGAEGMKKLIGASNCFVFGGSKEQETLSFISELIGDFEYEQRSTSSSSGRGGGSNSTSRQIQTRRTLSVRDLAALAFGRSVLITSGNPPTVIANVPWFEQDYAQKIKDSNSLYEPAGPI